jgi:cobalt/nickel transport system permease protein
MISEPFATGNSRIHRLDPRLRVVFATLYSFVVALSGWFPVLLAALFFSLMLVFYSRLDLWQIAKRAIVVNALIFLLWVVLPLTFEGEPLFKIGPLTVTRPGVILAAQITLKSNAILLAFISLVATMTFSTLGHALHRMRVPEKIVHLFLMSYRYVFVIDQEYQRLLTAAKIRGFRPSTSMHTYKTYAYLIGMLFVRAANRADRVHQAMLCRGFKGRFYSLQEFAPSMQNWIFSALMSFTIMGLALLELANT